MIESMDESFIASSAQDELNARIWTESPNLQTPISAAASDPEIGAQQTMPKPGEDTRRFSTENPLPWVPDLVGPEFRRSNSSVLIVGSSYNGFLDGYSGRQGRMSLSDYVAARDSHSVKDGLTRFSTSFIRGVVQNDSAYYARIRRLLDEAGIPMDRVCLTDLCKASFVRKVETPAGRSDEGGDGVVSQHMAQWQCYVLGSATEDLGTIPIPYDWLGQRMAQTHTIISLGKLAEYGVIKILKRHAPRTLISLHQRPHVQPNRCSLAPGRDWEYLSALIGRGVNSWLQSGEWWRLDDPVSGRKRKLLPCVHPSAWNNQEDRYVSGYGNLLRSMATVG